MALQAHGLLRVASSGTSLLVRTYRRKSRPQPCQCPDLGLPDSRLQDSVTAAQTDQDRKLREELSNKHLSVAVAGRTPVSTESGYRVTGGRELGGIQGRQCLGARALDRALKRLWPKC